MDVSEIDLEVDEIDELMSNESKSEPLLGGDQTKNGYSVEDALGLEKSNSAYLQQVNPVSEAEHFVESKTTNEDIEPETIKSNINFNSINSKTSRENVVFVTKLVESQTEKNQLMKDNEDLVVESEITKNPIKSTGKDCTSLKLENQDDDLNTNQTQISLEINIKVGGLSGFPTTCCSLPLESIKGKLLFCQTCREFYCTACKGENLESIWVCLFCQLKNVGVPWGGNGLSDTCTLDNLFTALTIKSIKKPEFLDLIKAEAGQDDAISATQILQEVIRLCTKREFSTAQKTWYNFLTGQVPNPLGQKTTKSLFGSPEEMIFKFIRQGGTFTRFSQCTNRRCTKPKSQDKFTELYLEKDTQLENVFRFTNCKDCQKRRSTSISMPNDQQSWYLLVENGNCNYTPEQLMELESHVLIGNTTFELSMITLHDKQKKHFTSMHFIDDEWVFYDSLGDKDKNRFRKPATEDFGLTAVNALYLPVIYETQSN